MSEKARRHMSGLVRVVAEGRSIAAWARANEIVVRTAYRWARAPEVREAVEAWRRRRMDRALGRLVMRSRWAVEGIAKLARSAESESVRLSALRSLLSDLMEVARFTSLEGRLADIEEKIMKQQRAVSPAY